MKIARIIIALVLLVVGLTTVPLFAATAQLCALVMCLHFIAVLVLVWDSNHLTPFFLFLAAFVFLFIGGRFWVTLIDPSWDVLTRGNFFDHRVFTYEEWLSTLRYILLFLYGSAIGYLLVNLRPIAPCKLLPNTDLRQWNLLPACLNVMLVIIACYVCINSFLKLRLAVQDGYLSLYLDTQNNAVQAGSGIWNALLWVFFGITMVYGTKYQRIAALVIISFKLVILAFIGQRGAAGCLLLFYFWYFCKDKNIALWKMAGAGLLLFAFLWLVGFLSMRYDETKVLSLNAFKQFFFAQGVSLSTFVDSMRIQDYPFLAYLANFFPGIGSINALISSHSTFAYETNFSHYLSFATNKIEYFKGCGLGWTILSDIYVFSKGHYVVFAILSLLFGLGCNLIETTAQHTYLCRIIVYTSFINFVFLPRAGLESIIPMIVWIICIYSILILIFRLQTHCTHSSTSPKSNHKR